MKYFIVYFHIPKALIDTKFWDLSLQEFYPLLEPNFGLFTFINPLLVLLVLMSFVFVNHMVSRFWLYLLFPFILH